ncbi:cyclin-T isoform X2 [Onthophagus taurus]|uniref:cyclin-T isoform X2 n=1 Tax=Onthophagus taurus TaxID=166361 RepID=UPI0039BE12C8
MANGDEKWYFSKERLENSPSRQCGIDESKELSYRQQAANFIQDMGQRLKVSQLCINTAIVYMHRFYVFHSFTHFYWASIASASIFLAAKVEEQPRKLEHVIKYANLCKNPHDTRIFEITSERYQAQSQDLVFNENILLQTLGFDVAIDHPHTHVVRCCHLVRASKDLAQTSYFMASNSLHLTTMCLQYKPTVVACFCIHLVCKWSNWEIPLSNERREWFSYVDPTVTSDLLKNLTEEFLTIFEKCPSRLKEKIMSIGGYFEGERRLGMLTDAKDQSHHRPYDSIKPGTTDDPHKHRPKPHDASSSSGSGGQHQQDREYRDKREAERMARHASAKQASSGSSLSKPLVPSGHHRPPVDPNKMKHNRPPSSGHSFSGSNSSSSSNRPDQHRDILREATRDIGLKEYHSVGNSREMRNEKDIQKRDSMLKPNVSVEGSVYMDRSSYAPTKPRPSTDPNKMPHRHEESKMFLKNENEIKKHLNSSSNVYEKIPYLNKPPAMQRNKPTENVFDPTKSVQKQQQPIKMETPNGQSNITSVFSVPILLDENQIKTDNKTEIIPPAVIKRPSLFSPEKSPPPPPPVVIKKEKHSPINPIMNKLSLDVPQTLSNLLVPPLSPFNSPDGEKQSDMLRQTIVHQPKLEQSEGFENILRDSGIKAPPNKHQVPDIITPIADVKTVPQPKEITKELKPPDLIPPFTINNVVNPSAPLLSQPLVNGIETNPTLISNLLKETASTVTHLPTISPPSDKNDSSKDNKDHHHKERKKKNKEKHKHKDKDRSKDDKEKKKKHKDKEKDKHKNKEKAKVEERIKITISKDKIQPPDATACGGSIKIKIPKDRIKTDVILEQPAQPPPPPPSTATHGAGGLKIKISKDVINHFSGNDNKKRERERTSPSDAPPNKLSKSSYNRTSDPKMNGRNSFGKTMYPPLMPPGNSGGGAPPLPHEAPPDNPPPPPPE